MSTVSGKLGAKRYRTRLKPGSGMYCITALLDLFFLLLFFILLASSVVRISGIQVDLPQAADVPQTLELGRSIVTITAEPQQTYRIYYRDRLVDENRLRNMLLDSNDKRLVIRADSAVPSGVLSNIMAIAEKAGMSSFIAVQPQEARPETRIE